jgi:transposase-like protein
MEPPLYLRNSQWAECISCRRRYRTETSSRFERRGESLQTSGHRSRSQTIRTPLGNLTPCRPLRNTDSVISEIRKILWTLKDLGSSIVEKKSDTKIIGGI